MLRMMKSARIVNLNVNKCPSAARIPELAETILNCYCSASGMQNLGIRCNDTMTGINWSQIPVVILEMGFMTNQQDDTNMSDATYRELMVDGIVDGINAYYGF